MAALPAFEDTLLPGKNGDVLKLDELWSFVQKKTQECWLWIALNRLNRADYAPKAAEQLRKKLGQNNPESGKRVQGELL